eukprot:1071199-Pyramimonas_sp.AAC.1
MLDWSLARSFKLNLRCILEWALAWSFDVPAGVVPGAVRAPAVRVPGVGGDPRGARAPARGRLPRVAGAGAKGPRRQRGGRYRVAAHAGTHQEARPARVAGGSVPPPRQPAEGAAGLIDIKKMRAS